MHLEAIEKARRERLEGVKDQTEKVIQFKHEIFIFL